MAMKSETNTPVLLTLTAVGAVLLLVLVLAVEAWFSYEFDQEEQAKATSYPNTTLANLRGEEQVRLNTYRWIDREKQIVAIPIDDAMKLLVQRKGAR